MLPTTHRAFTAKRGLFAVLGLAAACNQVFDIQEAHVDPTLAPNGGASGGLGGAGAANLGGSLDGALGGALDEAGGSHAGSSSRSGGAPNSSQGGKSAAGAGGAAVAGDVGQSAGTAGHHASGGAASTGAGGAITSAAGAGGEAGAAPTAPSLCVDYCNSITQYCSGDNLQYADLEQCLKVCEYFPQGVIGGPDGDSVACRLKYAGKARYAGGTELAAYCRQGGPGGDGRCGSNCEGFCDITQATCSDAETAPYFYPSRKACQDSCASLPQIPFSYGSKSSADGNSVQCRLFHVMSAAMADPGEHCAHVLGVTLCEAN